MALLGLQRSLLLEREEVLREIEIDELHRSAARFSAEQRSSQQAKKKRNADATPVRGVRRSSRQAGVAASPMADGAWEAEDGDWDSDDGALVDRRTKKRRGPPGGFRFALANTLGPKGVRPLVASLLRTLADMCSVRFDSVKLFDNKEYVQPITCGFCRQCTTCLKALYCVTCQAMAPKRGDAPSHGALCVRAR